MPEYEVCIKPLSPFQSPLQSDTIFGHICWAIRYISGEKALKKFLSNYSTYQAPLLVSSGMPKGYVPMPILRPLKPEEEEKTISFLLLFIIVMVGLEMGSGISASLNTNIFQIIRI